MRIIFSFFVIPAQAGISLAKLFRLWIRRFPTRGFAALGNDKNKKTLNPLHAYSLFAFLLCLLPYTAHAAKLANCDRQPYDVIIINGGAKRVVTIVSNGASIEEFGPTVSFQIEGHPPVVVVDPHDEYCIWHGRINIQRRNMGNGNGGFGFR